MTRPLAKPPSGEDIVQRIAALRQRRAAAAADLAELADRGDGQISRTDSDARLLTKSGQVVAGYNVQIAVDDKHKLIVASEVVNEGNDTGQLHAMAEAAKAALGAAALTVVADTGYYNGETLKACEDDAITAYVPPPDRDQRLKRRAGSALRSLAMTLGPTSTAVRPAPSCGRCAVTNVRAAASWRSAMPAAARSAGPARCVRDAWLHAPSGARSSAGCTRLWSSATGRACVLLAKT
jgi:Transposase DDE domain